MNNATKISNMILNYESKFDRFLKDGYDNDNVFLKDITKYIQNNKINDILHYYKTDLVSRNETNLTFEQRKALNAIILELEGQIK